VSVRVSAAAMAATREVDRIWDVLRLSGDLPRLVSTA
jgi:hypothetical protein